MAIVDRKKRPYSPEEKKIVGQKPGIRPGLPPTSIFNAPISYRENALSLFWDKKPCFIVTGSDFNGLNPEFYQKKLSRSLRNEGSKIDTFGVKWIFENTAGGSISESGHPLFDDVNDWKNVIQMPDVNDWDWAADAEKNKVDSTYAVEMTAVNGFWFERLISFMDFVNAAVALVDDEQTDAIQELFEATTALACDVVDKICEYWPCVDGFMLHDDWGSQREPFFSDRIARELFLPHMKKIVDHVHAKGRYCGIHSCGHIEDRIPVFIDAGLDTWQLQMNCNNVDKMYDLYGDKIVLQIAAKEFDMNDEKAAVQAARDYVDHYCQPGKPSMMVARTQMTNPVFAEEVYEYSRKHYLKQ